MTPLELIDKAIAIASRPDVIFCSFGDMLRVPGAEARSAFRQGGRRRCADRLFAARLPEAAERKTRGERSSSSPSASRRPRRPTPWLSGRPISGGLRRISPCWSRMCSCRRRCGAIVVADESRAGISGSRARLHGHGLRRIRAAGRRFHIPIVVTGFEPLDLLEGIYRCVSMLEEGRSGRREPVCPCRLPRRKSRPRAARGGLRDQRSQMAGHRRHSAAAAFG